MNLERGVRRITLVVSVAVGLGAWVYSSALLFDHWHWEREQYLAYKGKYENIKWFWETWDADGWTRGGSKMNKDDVLYALLDSPWRGMPFTRGEEVGSSIEFTLSGCDVLPGMHAAMLDLPAVALAEAVRKARNHGECDVLLDYVYAQTFWTKRTEPQLVVFGTIFGIPIGTGAFIVVWLLLFLFKWIGRGFCADVPKTDKTSTGADTRVVAEMVDPHDSQSLSQEVPAATTR